MMAARSVPRLRFPEGMSVLGLPPRRSDQRPKACAPCRPEDAGPDRVRGSRARPVPAILRPSSRSPAGRAARPGSVGEGSAAIAIPGRSWPVGAGPSRGRGGGGNPAQPSAIDGASIPLFARGASAMQGGGRNGGSAGPEGGAARAWILPSGSRTGRTGMSGAALPCRDGSARSSAGARKGCRISRPSVRGSGAGGRPEPSSCGSCCRRIDPEASRGAGPAIAADGAGRSGGVAVRPAACSPLWFRPEQRSPDASHRGDARRRVPDRGERRTQPSNRSAREGGAGPEPRVAMAAMQVCRTRAAAGFRAHPAPRPSRSGGAPASGQRRARRSPMRRQPEGEARMGGGEGTGEAGASLLERMRRGDRLVATLRKTPSHVGMEIPILAGLDFVCLDAGHGPFDRAAMPACLAVARARATSRCSCGSATGRCPASSMGSTSA